MGARRDHTATIGTNTWEPSVPVICSAESIARVPWVNLGPFGRICGPMTGADDGGADDGNRTRVASWEDWGSTIELHPRAASRLVRFRGSAAGRRHHGATGAKCPPI